MLIDDLAELRFDNRFSDSLPADPQRMNLTRPVEGASFSWVRPKGMAAPKLVAHSAEVAALLGLSDKAVASARFTAVFAGSEVLPGMAPFAMCYGGHQFGHWAGQLGDGRAINLGQAIATDGKPWYLQLKGAGPTPYSRTADGLAVLRSSVREFLCSEAMFHLGVPTTRALSLVTTGEEVMRDMFYDGNPQWEKGAVVCRVSRSFTRFGSFELPASRGDNELLKKLADHTITECFAELVPASGVIDAGVYAAWFAEVANRTADLMVHWGRVGFVHGVMNTDNMSILGETIDYGPYGWLEDYDPDWTPNTTDAGGRRYAFGKQSQIGIWNLVRLAHALHPLVGDTAPLQAAIDGYGARYSAGWRAMMATKLGLEELRDDADLELVQDLLRLMSGHETDMTLLFRELARVPLAEVATLDPLVHLAAFEAAWHGTEEGAEEPTDEHRAACLAWMQRYAARLATEPDLSGEGADLRRRARMDAVNPRFVLRNYLAQVAIDAADEGDNSKVLELLDTLRRPYDEQPGREHLAQRRPEWARSRPGCSMLSCSS
ncbi:MAG: YdiU family protein [Planctomycetota bacterium]|nr:YdiU family protein [Planctomycetota bacterium]